MHRIPVLVLFSGLAAMAGPAAVVDAQLAGRTIASFPHFEHVRSFHPDQPIFAAIDPGRFPQIVGQTCDVFVVDSKDAAGWEFDATLTDVRGSGAQTFTFSNFNIQGNTLQIAAAGELDAAYGAGLGVGYDVVLDCNRNGLLDGADLIDGRGEIAGFYAVHDTTQTGPATPKFVEYSGPGTWLSQRTHYPKDIATLGQLPLVVISHGWTLNWRQYDHIGAHLASYRYVAMSHTSDVQNGGPPGTLAAAISLLENVDYMLANLDTIAGGLFDGHIDTGRIVFTGHSTGGEAVVRAYTMLRQGEYVSPYFDADDVVLVSSIAPVNWHPASLVNPFDVNYHMWVAAADIDTSGAPVNNYQQPMVIYERATGNRQLTYIQGAGHLDLCDCTGSSWADGPDLIGRTETHKIVKAYFLPLVELYVRDNPAAMDFFTRPFETFRPPSIDPSVIIANEYKDAVEAANFVVDDFESGDLPFASSSTTDVVYNVQHITEVLMRDHDSLFDWNGTGANGMTRSRFADDITRALVFDWTTTLPRFLEVDLLPEHRDLTDDGYLSFRACQGTRHPETDALNAPLSFTVSLVDHSAASSSVGTAGYGRLTRPYLRGGYGGGAGWQNEFTTIRIPLADFANNHSPLDLTDVAKIRFDFGFVFGSDRGRIGIDDLEITNTQPPEPFALRIDRGAGGVTMSWPKLPQAFLYNVYRGTLPETGLATRGDPIDVYDHVCFERRDTQANGLLVSVDDDPIPPGASGYYYLVGAVTPDGESLGDASIDLLPVPGVQTARLNLSPCPP